MSKFPFTSSPFDDVWDNDPDLMLQWGLDYIANSPKREHGGFCPTTVKIAKMAIAEIERLRDEIGELRKKLAAETDTES